MRFRALTIFLLIFVEVLSEKETYRGAVVGYFPKLTAETPTKRFMENVGEYLKFIKSAGEQAVDIIVFPEDALTGWYDMVTDKKKVKEISTEVPPPDLHISPCTAQNSSYSEGFVKLSCAARSHKIYVVVNLVERSYERGDKEIFHNTNVVFDRKGRVVARYRKINLFNEPFFEPGDEPTTFETDFGVKFGMFICFDIMFKNPALDVLADPEVTDVVYSVAWFSHLPFLQGLSVHHGYATSAQVNVLAAGYDNPSSKNGGSAIYLKGGRIAKMHLSGVGGSKMLVHDVPKIKKINPSTSTCQSPTWDLAAEDVSLFVTSQEDMANYTFRNLDLNRKTTHEKICAGTSTYCCDFDVTLKESDGGGGGPSKSTPTYVYKFVAFHGASLVSLTDTTGIRTCAIVACLDDDISTCGGRRKGAPEEGIIFEKITVRGTFNAKDSYDQPSTLTADLRPLNKYKFCKKENRGEIDVLVETEGGVGSLLTFGILGRVFGNDGKPNGPIQDVL